MSGSAVKNAQSYAEDVPRRDFFWRTTEIARLERLSKEEVGVEQLLKELPGRSLDAIKRKAAECSLPLPLPKPAAAWRSDEASDQLIREAYAKGSRGAISDLAIQLQVDSWRLSKRAAELGVSTVRTRSVDWAADELAILEDFAEQGAGAVLRELRKAGAERSAAAVATKLAEWMRKNEKADSWSAREVGELMGVNRNVVLRWIAQRGLKARQDAQQWHISRRDLREWVVSHAGEVDLRFVDKFWFVDMLGSR